MKKTLSIILALMLTFVLSTGVFASTSKTGNDVPVNITVAGVQFNVTVPTAIPIDVSATNVVTVASDLKITNNSAGPIKITEIKLVADSSAGWTILDYANDLSSKAFGTKEFSIELGKKTKAPFSFDTATGKFTGFTAENSVIATSGEYAIAYNAKVAPQVVELPTTKIATMTFAFDWDTV